MNHIISPLTRVDDGERVEKLKPDIFFQYELQYASSKARAFCLILQGRGQSKRGQKSKQCIIPNAMFLSDPDQVIKSRPALSKTVMRLVEMLVIFNC